MSARPNLSSICLMLLTLNLLATLGTSNFYPELRSDLQVYQDTSRCYPNVGEWYLMYRNYYADPLFGGTAKCVKYNRYGEYEYFSTPAVLTFGQEGYLTGRITLTSSPCYVGKNRKTFNPNGDAETQESFHTIYISCDSCFIARHPYAANGYGCSYWRRSDVALEPDDCCEFIYDENCGTAPKYKMYDRSCTWAEPPNATATKSKSKSEPQGAWLSDEGY
ncbi:uncharacterized protein LOC144105135 [Amblyomma americanum]